ncbi:hypothetical protein M3Y94_00763500 [Aphelenchoides besseyi]|nr:hypothetical protein M3Y94_00763500 [Aphelenchoides besseyi]KAI6232197.1 Carboxypeptidase [Aphelenchoides besseyi]
MQIVWLFVFLAQISLVALTDKTDDRITLLPDYEGPEISFKQYSGYLPLSSGNELFYWLTQSSSSTSQTDPVLLYLNGGPGCSSMNALMTEMGPYRITNDGKKLTNNPFAWNRFAHIIYLDAPAGVGLSKNNVGNYTFTDSQVASDNLEALLQFFQRFPELTANDFYVGGESYAGTYVPMLADLIIKNAKEFPTFKGIIVGNGCLNEKLRFNSQIVFNYNHDFIAEEDYRNAVISCCNGKSAETCDWYALANGSRRKCAEIANSLEEANFYSGLDPYFINYSCYFNESSDSIEQPHSSIKSTSFHFRRRKSQRFELATKQSCLVENVYVPYINREDVQRAIHVVPQIEFESCSEKISEHYIVEYEDMSEFVDRIVAAEKQVLFFNGDADTVCSFVHNQKFVKLLGYQLISSRRAWNYANKVPSVAGYYTGYNGVDFLTIQNGGHFSASTLEKPRESLQMFYNFLRGTHNYSEPVL